MSTVVLSGTVIASFLAGMVALFAPCCISVMLPAYFASSVERRRALVGMTFLFAAGVSLIILPIALGSAALGAAINRYHFAVYLAGGLLMLAFGVFMLAGGRLALPMPGMRARLGSGPLSVVALGAFSGVASACCAPVLAGVLALAGVSASFGAALVLGVAYVFGMVFPLFVIALLWDRFNWGESRLLRGWRFHFRVLGRRVSMHSTALVSGLLLLGMGAFVIVIAFNGNAMPSSGWRVSFSARLQHYASVLTDWLQTAPGWVTSFALIAILAFLAWKALGQAAERRRAPNANGPSADRVALERPKTRAKSCLAGADRIAVERPKEESVEWQNS